MKNVFFAIVMAMVLFSATAAIAGPSSDVDAELSAASNETVSIVVEANSVDYQPTANNSNSNFIVENDFNNNGSTTVNSVNSGTVNGNANVGTVIIY